MKHNLLISIALNRSAKFEISFNDKTFEFSEFKAYDNLTFKLSLITSGWRAEHFWIS